MRWKTITLGIIFTVLSGISLVDRSQAQGTVNIGLFYEELSPYGEWSPHVEFGYIWQPYEVGPEWKPYTDGRWAWSDQGWIWISYEPWGWATYHYGRWIFDDYQGWIWIPGTTWAPAWVSWHQSPEYIGWSPLPPDRGFFIEIGFVFNSFKTNYYKPYHSKHHHHHKKKHRHKKHRYYHEYYHNPHNYRPPARHCVFLPYNNFGHHKHAGKAAVPPPHYDIVLRNSKNVTKIRHVNNKIINYGPDKHLIEKRSNKKLVRHNIVDRNKVNLRSKKNVNIIKDNSYNVYRPKIERGNKNPYITNRNQINKNRVKNNSGNSLPQKRIKFNKPPKNRNFNSNHTNHTRIVEPQKKSDFSPGKNNKGNSGIKNKKVSKQNQKSKINKKNYHKTPDRYNKYSYKKQQQRNSGRVEPAVRTKTYKGNKASINKRNFNKKKTPSYKNTVRSNTNSNSQYERNSRAYNQPNKKSLKKSGNKNYSNKHKKVSRNKSNVSQRSSYKSKNRTMPSSRKPTLTKR
ncbi:MAG: hypothetical protein DHS20C13_11970 [Thermodesulfobacteriota bacterium]|nr:MAG: hypothetical protein DHS20C13_11970 [Thermodesulfobacteriota bacterium]